MTSWVVPATVLRVVDGDTIRLRLDLGWNVHLEVNCRILGVNSPEVDTPAGKTAKAWATALLSPGTPVTYTSTCLDKYGRPLGALSFGKPARDYGYELITAGQAVYYDGGARQAQKKPGPQGSGLS